MLIRLSSSQQTLLQWIALVVMTLDHYVMIFHDASHWIHYLSRFVYPMFAYLVVYNYLYRTSNQLKYLGRLLLWGVISQPFYSWAFDLPFYKLNILFTLFLGLTFLYGHAYLKARFHSHLALVLSGYFIMGLLFFRLGCFRELLLVWPSFTRHFLLLLSQPFNVQFSLCSHECDHVECDIRKPGFSSLCIIIFSDCYCFCKSSCRVINYSSSWLDILPLLPNSSCCFRIYTSNINIEES